MSATVTEAAVLHALRGVHDPDRGEDIVTVGLVKDLHIHDADVMFTLACAGQSPAAKASYVCVGTRMEWSARITPCSTASSDASSDESPSLTGETETKKRACPSRSESARRWTGTRPATCAGTA